MYIFDKIDNIIKNMMVEDRGSSNHIKYGKELKGMLGIDEVKAMNITYCHTGKHFFIMGDMTDINLICRSHHAIENVYTDYSREEILIKFMNDIINSHTKHIDQIQERLSFITGHLVAIQSDGDIAWDRGTAIDPIKLHNLLKEEVSQLRAIVGLDPL